MSKPWKHHAKLGNGFRMHYVIVGSGYPLVLLHGWPQSRGRRRRRACWAFTSTIRRGRDRKGAENGRSVAGVAG